jgi:exodeoxyribonuclease VII small subunit
MAKKDVEPAQPPAFESALGELEKLVEKMERGDVSLEESLRMFERGVELARHCQTALREKQNPGADGKERAAGARRPGQRRTTGLAGYPTEPQPH